ncbi:hypothetical protein P5Y53_15730 [Dyella jiangningensis]|nr:hypothetical protein [Dyella jiangningensis]MDG2539128.1 hypothetical protein [Dyella jiangningensis]
MNGDIELNDPFLSPAVESMEAACAHGSALAAGADEPDPEYWQPL